MNEKQETAYRYHMRPDQRDKIDTLLLRHLSDNLSPAETAALQRFADDHPETRMMLQKLQARMNTADAQDFKASLNPNADWFRVTQRIHENKQQARRRKLRFGVILTSMTAVIVYSSALCIRQIVHKTQSHKQGSTRSSSKPPALQYSNTGR